MTISDQITRLNNAKAAIKQSLTNKGVEVSDSALLDEYPALIDSIEVGSGGGDPIYEEFYNVKTNNGTDFTNLFNGYPGDTLDVSNWDTSKVTSMTMMFQGCTSLTQLNLSNFDTSNLSIMDSMFDGCTSLTTLDLSNWDATFVFSPDWDMRDMFLGCTSLHTLRLDNCNNDTISKIIKTIGFPTGAISGVTRTIYCKESEVAGLTAPTNWVFSYVD